MTVANIRDRAGAEYVEVVFLESARFFRLLRKNPTFDDSYKRLREAIGKGRVLQVGLASPESDLIEEIEA
jgi:hypothetical protein